MLMNRATVSYYCCCAALTFFTCFLGPTFSTSEDSVGSTGSDPRIIEHPENQFVAKNEPATLNCKAEGNPPPVITWYRDGQPVVTANENPSSHRMLLPSGQLFFLRIISNKNTKPDLGVYYCNATNPETRVSVVSRSATLELAVLGSEFRDQPRNLEVAMGLDALLDCKAPKGEPEPRIRWKKDGEALKPTERISITETGSLKIQDSRREDSGVYVCVAYNVAGEKESASARLSVRERPRIIEGPKDVTVIENSDVSFHCTATGDPKPAIIWKRTEEQMPQGRLHILEDRSLKIERVRLMDEGVYVCRAENTIGFQEAEAKLIVHSQPSFLATPRDKVAGIGRKAIFRCEVTGNPIPAVFWNKEGSQNLIFPNQDNGRLSVSDDGTLTIESVEKEDAGEYVCKGLSIAGSAFAKARLEVKDVDSRPPPIIHQGPQNQTLPVSSIAMLPCLASGEPVPVIRWHRNGRVISLRDPRITILDSGTLQISDLRKTDSGLYTCKATSETGETGWSAALMVEMPTNPTIIFHRTPEPSTFPGPPSKPAISDVTETSVRLTWRNNANPGASAVLSYTVEYFSHETGRGWIVASDVVVEQTYTVRGLQPDTAYMFLVRAQNSHGLSLPSQVTAPIRTKGVGISQSRPTIPSYELALVAEKLSSQVVTLLSGEVMSSTAVKVTWEIRKNGRFIEGFHIHYRTIMELEGQSGGASHGAKSFLTETLQSSSATMYTLHNLDKDSWYEIHVQPFYQSVIGQASNTIRVKTLEDTPSAAPQNVHARMVDNNTLHITWDTPPRQHFNGALRGYKIYIYGNETRFDREIQINSSLDSIYIHGMIKDMNYKIQMSAWNKMGEGLRSEAIQIGPMMSSLRQNLFQEPWFIATLIVSIGGILWLSLCLFSIWVYKKRKACKKIPKSVHPNKVAVDCPRNGGGTVHASAVLNGYMDKENMVDSAEKSKTMEALALMSKEDLSKETLTNLQSPFVMKTFYNKSLNVAPYATTSLISASLAGGDGASDGVYQNSTLNEPDYNEIENCSPGRQDVSTSDSNNDTQNIHDDPSHLNSMLPKPLMLYLPPPPEHPPPSDIGTPPESPVQGLFGDKNFASGYFVNGNPHNLNLRPLHSDCEREKRSRNLPPANWSGSLNPRSDQLFLCRPHLPGGLPAPSHIHSHDQRPLPPNPRTEFSNGYSKRPLLGSDYNGQPSAFRNARLPLVRDVEPGQSYGNCDPAVNAVRHNLRDAIRGGANNLWMVPSDSMQPYEPLDSPISEVGVHDYDPNSDIPLPNPGEYQSASEAEHFSVAEKPVEGLWEGMANDSDGSSQSSEISELEIAFLPEVDFASAVARAAQLSGLTVIDPVTGREKVKKPAKYRQRARCTSPYSTDSNYSTIQVPHRPFPRSDRKRQLREQGNSGRYNDQESKNNLSRKT